MPRIAYVNGRYVPHRDASVHIEDRGYQFADGVYEVVALLKGRMIDKARHLDRLERSLEALSLDMPLSRRAMEFVLGQVVRRNRIANGLIYLQVTRGVAPRNHAFPKNAKPSFVVTVRPIPSFDKQAVLAGVKVITAPDIRWKRCDIKTISLLPNAMLKQKAVEAGGFETWMTDDDGYITEGTASNAWIVTKAGELRTRKLGPNILSGITRAAVVDIAKRQGLKLDEHSFTKDDVLDAQEAFLTSATSFVKPVTHIDGQPIGDGKAGDLTTRLLEWYAEFLETGQVENG